MLIKQETLKGVADGSITLAFRRWRRPTVRAGGTLLTTAGQVAIDSVDQVEMDDITEPEAVAAGCSDLQELHALLRPRTEGSLYRIALHLAGPDPRIALRESTPRERGEFEEIASRLARWDKASKSGPWTESVMYTIQRRAAVRAGDPASEAGRERDHFKVNVRKLKGLGLTESLEVGYRLSPRGDAVLGFLRERYPEPADPKQGASE